MKFSVSSYSYMQGMRSGRLTLEDVVDTAARQGFQGIEFVPFGAFSDETLARAKALGRRAREAGMDVVCYAVGNDFLAQPVADCVQKLTGELKIAEALGAPLMRHDETAGFPAGHEGPSLFKDALPRLIEGTVAVADIAEQMGIRTCVENHGFFCQDSARVKSLIVGANHKNFGWLVDMGNFLCADEAPESGVKCAAPYAFHAHAKDFRFISASNRSDAPGPNDGWFKSRGGNHLKGTIISHGVVPVSACMRLLRRAGYDGYVTVEFEGAEPCETACEIGLENLRLYAR